MLSKRFLGTAALFVIPVMALFLFAGAGPRDQWCLLGLSSSVTILGIVVGGAVFALAKRSRPLRWYVRVVSAISSALLAAVICATALLLCILPLLGVSTRFDDPHGMGIAIVASACSAFSAVIAAVFGAGAGQTAR